MPFDYKKEYKQIYMPPTKPGMVDVPEINYAAVRGEGDPNEIQGAYKAAISTLYAIGFTIKMSYKGPHKIDGYFPYVMPPLEGLWTQKGREKIDYAHKEEFQWISMIRLPEFVTEKEFYWAVKEAERKKKADLSTAEFFTYHEGMCVQCMHIGSYDNEPETIKRMEAFALEQGCLPDLSNTRFHHEIYLSNPQRVSPEKIKTVIRCPVKVKELD